MTYIVVFRAQGEFNGLKSGARIIVSAPSAAARYTNRSMKVLASLNLCTSTFSFTSFFRKRHLEYKLAFLVSALWITTNETCDLQSNQEQPSKPK